jgi:hypothetical protein
MIIFDLNLLVSTYNYSELFMTDKELDNALNYAHRIRSNAKVKRNIVSYEKSNDDIDCLLINKDIVKQALIVKERESVQIFRNRLIGKHYLN